MEHASEHRTVSHKSDMGYKAGNLAMDDRGSGTKAKAVLRRNKSPLMAAVWASIRAAIRTDYPEEYDFVHDVLMTAMHHLEGGGPISMGLPSWWNNTAYYVSTAVSPLDKVALRLEAAFQKCSESDTLVALESTLVLPKRTNVRTQAEHKKYLADLGIERVQSRIKAHQESTKRRSRQAE
jgi:hypothetical protein